jgi:RNA polymerase sigma-70 factor (ECF subfamily)
VTALPAPHGRREPVPAGPAAALVPWTDEEVVERVLAGDRALFEVLVRRHNGRLYRAARAILRRDDEAEDAVQDAYVGAFAELSRFRGDAPFGAWLLRIAVNAALARRRRGRTLVAIDPVRDGLAEVETMDHGDDPERATGNRELRHALEAAVDALPAPLRTVFVLRDVEGLSTAEAAAALGLSAENVKVRLHRARAALRQRLDEALGRETRRLYSFDGERCDRIVAAVLARIG